MLSWFKSDKKRAQEKSERDAQLRAELAIKARQFDEENKHLFEEKTEVTRAEVVEPEQTQSKKPDITIYDVSTRTSFNF